VAEKGALGILTGGLTAASGGIGAAIMFAFLVSLVFKPKEKG
jgi:stage V sporulation protein AE